MRIRNHSTLQFLFLLANINIVFSQGSWYKLESVTERNLSKVEFVDSLTGWASGEGGTIVKTTDGGNSWIQQATNVQNNIQDLFILDKNNGWAISHQYMANSDQSGTNILNTTDGGEHWQTEFMPDEYVHAIYFNDSLNGWIGGATGFLRGTSDRGITWYEVTVDSIWYSYLSIYDFKFFNSQYGLAIGGFIDIAGVIWRTTDGGQYWSTVRLGSEPLHTAKFLDSLEIIAIGGDLEYGAVIVRSTDAGINWSYETVGIFGEGIGLAFADDKEAWVTLGYSGTYMYSLDTGHTWTAEYTPDSTQVYDIVFTDPAHGYIVGNYGSIFKYLPVATGVENDAEKMPAGYILFQNYPNPFNPVTKINFSIPQNLPAGSTKIKLTVYDLLGREIAVLLDKDSNGQHEYSVEFDASGLSSGIYLYKLRAGDFISVKKMILLK